MSIENLDHLSDTYIDVLREIGNVGTGNAATSLAAMLNRKINITVPTVRIMDISDVDEALGGPETPVVAILAEVRGDIQGIMMFVIGKPFTEDILHTLLNEETVDCIKLSDMEKSALSEIGNIMIGSYVNAIAALSNLFIDISVPAVTADMVGSLLTVPAAEMGAVSDKIIFVEDTFQTSVGGDVTANMLLIPSLGSLNKLMNGLGIAL